MNYWKSSSYFWQNKCQSVLHTKPFSKKCISTNYWNCYVCISKILCFTCIFHKETTKKCIQSIIINRNTGYNHPYHIHELIFAQYQLIAYSLFLISNLWAILKMTLYIALWMVICLCKQNGYFTIDHLTSVVYKWTAIYASINHDVFTTLNYTITTLIVAELVSILFHSHFPYFSLLHNNQKYGERVDIYISTYYVFDNLQSKYR